MPGEYSFFGNDPESYAQLQQRRAIALALASRNKGFPKTKGEGLAYLGDSIGEALTDLGLQRREAAQRARDKTAQYPSSTIAPQQGPIIRPQQQTSLEPQKPAPPPPPPPVMADTGPATVPPAVLPTGVDTSGFADPSLSVGDFPASAPTAPFPSSFGDRFSGDTTPPAAPVPPVSVDPNAAAPLTGGVNAIDMSQPATTVPPVQTAAAPLPDQGGYNAIDAAAPPAPAPTVPLPRGDPRTTGGVRATMAAILARRGRTPTEIAGIERNVQDESGFDPGNVTRNDQPRFTGEARHAHGLYQEGGDEWNLYANKIAGMGPGVDWRDPALQTQNLADRLEDPQYARTSERMAAAQTPGEAAASFVSGYLKPAKQFENARVAKYLREDGGDTYADRQLAQDGSVSPAAPGSRIASGGGVEGRQGGAPVDDTRDLITSAMLAQQAPQAPQVAPSEQDQTGNEDQRIKQLLLGGRQPGSPFRATASAGRAGVVSDAPSPAMSPMGSLGGARDGVANTLMQQQQPAPAPTDQAAPVQLAGDVPLGGFPGIAGAGVPSPSMPPAAAAAPPAQAPIGQRLVAPAATDQGIRPIPKAQDYPDPGRQPTLQDAMTPEIAKEMAFQKRIATDQSYSPEIQKAAAARYTELHGQVQDQYTKIFGFWKEQKDKQIEYGLKKDSTQLGLESSVLGVEKSRRELEGEGAFPISDAEKAQLFPRGLPPGVEVYRTRRGDLKEVKGPQTVTVDQRGENEFAKVTGKALAEHFVEGLKEGNTAASDLATITELRQQAAKVGGGASPVVQELLGRYGIKTEGLGDVQAYNALINRLTPQQRVPGTGSSSDFDVLMFRASLPQLSNTPEGKALIMDTMERLAKNKLDRSEISGAVVSGQMTPQEGVKAMIGLQAQARAQSDNVKAYIDRLGKGDVRSAEDTQALDWANRNPGDPRAIEIKRRLGGP